MSSPVHPQNAQPTPFSYGRPSPQPYGFASAPQPRKSIPLAVLIPGMVTAVVAIIGLFVPYYSYDDDLSVSWSQGMSEDYISSAPFLSSIIVLILALVFAVAPAVAKSSKAVAVASGVVQIAAGGTVLGNVIRNSESPDVSEVGLFDLVGIGWYLLLIGSIALLAVGLIALIVALRAGRPNSSSVPGVPAASGPAPYGVPPAYPQGQPGYQPGQQAPGQPSYQPGQQPHPQNQPSYQPGQQPQGQPSYQPGQQNQPSYQPGQQNQPSYQPGQQAYRPGQAPYQSTPPQQATPQQTPPSQGQSPYQP